MAIPTRVLPLLLVAPLVAVAASCVELRHPLSDEKTSKIDERLVGTWEQDTMVLYVKWGRDKKSLDVEWTETGKEGRGRLLAFTTTVKKKSYVSIKDLDKDAQKDRKGAYDIYQYRLVDNDTLEVRGMDENVLQKAVAQKTLAGTLGKDKTPTITAEPKDIARYLEDHADECYPVKTDYMLTFKRRK